jgi:hypothetical protein
VQRANGARTDRAAHGCLALIVATRGQLATALAAKGQASNGVAACGVGEVDVFLAVGEVAVAVVCSGDGLAATEAGLAKCGVVATGGGVVINPVRLQTISCTALC